MLQYLYMTSLKIISEKRKQVIDITSVVEKETQKNGIREGLCTIFVKHTTASLTTADLDPGTDLDMLDAFEAMLPKLEYRHPHNPSHVVDHILSSLIGASITLPIENGALVLGDWQRIVLIESDGPRERELIVTFIHASEHR